MFDSSIYFSRISELLDFLEIEKVENCDFSPNFPMRVPLEYAKKMEKGNAEDPLLRQVLPTLLEKECFPGFSDDPVGDLKAEQEKGILQKYHGRILLITTGNCSVRCRFCFRRNSSFKMQKELSKQLMNLLTRDNSIHEIIFSGGDPLTAPISYLEEIIKSIVPAKAVQTLRFHTRVPLTEPSKALKYISLFAKYKERFHFVVVLHSNHPRELSGDTILFLQECQKNQIHLLNQSVLLKGINDNAKTLVELSEKLFECGVLPYYLHMLDRANGAAHFEVEEARAKEIHKELLKLLPGYLVPKLVREIAGECSKTPIF